MNDDWPISSTARRNAACRAACEGIPTEALEDNAVADILEALRGLVAEHLPEVKANYEYILTEGNHAQIDQAESDLKKWENARAAIARATGEKP